MVGLAKLVLSSAVLSVFLGGTAFAEARLTDEGPWLATSLSDEVAGMDDVDGCWQVFESRSIPTSICRIDDSREAAAGRDVVYTVLEGSGSLAVGGTVTEFEAGAVLYVGAGNLHRIAGDNIVAVAFETTGVAGDEAPSHAVFTAADVREGAKADENVWNPFLRPGSMVYGLYMLPIALDGDSTLTHPVDEINLVVKGKSRFHMDADEIDVAPGSIVWVSNGVGHYFDELSEDFEVFILFHRPAP